MLDYSYLNGLNYYVAEIKDDDNNTTTYTWNWGRNYLLSGSQAGGSTSYEYDGDGTRLSKTRIGVKTKYISDVARPLALVQVLMETNSTGEVQAIYTYGNDLISMNRADANSYYHYDGLGSTRQLTNSTGAVTVSYTYDSYGNLIASTGTSANTYGFTGEQQFGEADSLVFLRARYYKPSIGRFISADPIGYRGGLNLYRYVKNNPVNRTDPTGLASCDEDDCTKADPVPSYSRKCDSYGDETYLGVSLSCFCRCAGDSAWSQQVRGCLACEHAKGTNPYIAHARCYNAAGWTGAPWGTLTKCYAICLIAD